MSALPLVLRKWGTSTSRCATSHPPWKVAATSLRAVPCLRGERPSHRARGRTMKLPAGGAMIDLCLVCVLSECVDAVGVERMNVDRRTGCRRGVGAGGTRTL